MRIAFMLGKFPSISQTFILNQIICLIDRGVEVRIYADSSESGLYDNSLIEQYDLLERTKYIPVMPYNKITRIGKAFSLLFKYFFKKPLSIIGTFNFFKYGKDALNLRLFYRAIPLTMYSSFDIMHCQFGQYGLMGVRLRELGFFQAKVVTSFRGVDLSRRLKLKGKQTYKELFEKGDLFLPVCDYFKNRLIELGCDEDKIIVHRSGIKLNTLKYIPRNVKDKQYIQLFSIGRLVEKKGFEYSIKAVAKVIEDYNYQIKYTIIGEGPLMDNLKELIVQLGMDNNIKMLGAKKHDEVIQHMYESQLFIAPSITSSDGDQEGIPNVLKEAMATGMPVISTYHSGIPELVEDGVSGVLTPERNVDVLAEKIKYMIDNSYLWKELGSAGRKAIEKDYDIDKLNHELIGIYKDLLSHY